jgi:hypothetical protein
MPPENNKDHQLDAMSPRQKEAILWCLNAERQVWVGKWYAHWSLGLVSGRHVSQ